MNKDRFKFRVWNKEEKKMYYDAQNTYDYMTGEPIIFAESFGCLLNNDDEWEVEQCTGLKDKNGNLIYEGDIIRFCLNTRGYVLAYERAVVWDNESSSFMIVSNLDQVKPRTKRQMPNTKTHNIEIIGNIHEQAEQKDNK